MNKLTNAQRAQIIALLCEGNSIRACVRLTGASKNTIAKLIATLAELARSIRTRLPQPKMPPYSVR